MNPDDLLTVHEATQLISSRIITEGELKRDVENRVSHRISDHVKKGLLPKRSDEKFVLKQLMAWAQELYPSKFDDLPAIKQIQSDFEISYDSDMPESLEQCQHDLRNAYKTIEELKKQVSILKPAALKYARLSEKNKINGKSNKQK